MNPLFGIGEARKSGRIPEDLAGLIESRFPIIVSGINRIEKASGLRYPAAYIEPSAIVSQPDPGAFQYGILFARTIPLDVGGRLQVVIQISAPLAAYGLKGTVHAILAHEFLHYLELMRRVSQMHIISDEVSGSIFENVYADEARLFEPRAVFDDETLLRHITRKFPSGFRDYKLEDKTLKYWIAKNLPKTNITLDSNTTRLSPEVLAKIRLDPAFVSRLDMIEQKSVKIRRRQRY